MLIYETLKTAFEIQRMKKMHKDIKKWVKPQIKITIKIIYAGKSS